MSLSVSLILIRLSSHEVALYLPMCFAMFVMKECFPVKALPATKMFPSMFDYLRTWSMASRQVDFCLWSTVNFKRVSQRGWVFASIAEISLIVSIFVRTDIILMPFSLHCFLKVSSMQAEGFLISRSSIAILELSSTFSRLVTYFLMRFSLGLGR